MTSVLHLCRRFFPQRGGSETYTGALIPALAAGGVGNLILAAGAPEAEYVWRGVPVMRADDKELLQESGSTRFFDRFVLLLDTHRPDIVHWHFLPDEAELLLDASISRNVRNVHTLHHPVTLCARHDLIRFGREPCDRNPSQRECGPCMGHFRGLPASVATAFTATARMIPKFVKHQLPPSRIKTSLTLADDIGRWIQTQQRSLRQFDAHVVLSAASAKVLQRCGVDSASICISRLGNHHAAPLKPAWVSWKGAQRPMRVIFVGRLAAVKGVVTLAEAASSFSAAELQLDIYGASGDADATIEAFVRKSGSPIRYHGQLADDDVVERMSGYDFVAIPSQFFETGPFTAVEALQAGTPILAADIPSLNEFIEVGNNGWLVKAASVESWRSVLRSSINHPELAGQMREGLAYQRSMEDVANEMSEVYRRVATNGRIASTAQRRSSHEQ